MQEEQNKSKQYTNGEFTVVWKPEACIHSTICWRRTTGLPEVFNPKERPWINMKAGTAQQIEAQVNKCPSGALSFFYNEPAAPTGESELETRVEILPSGPLLVYGNIVVKDKTGAETRKSKVTAFCRCGMSANKPYCDGSHIKTGFNDESLP
jgi:uncharacterized Fe-S cluster protein YjdI